MGIIKQILEQLQTARFEKNHRLPVLSSLSDIPTGLGKAGILTTQNESLDPIKVSGMGPSGKTFILASLCDKSKTPALLLTASQDQAEQFAQDLEFFLGIYGAKIPVAYLPPLEVPTAWSASLQRELTGQRMKALLTVLQEKQSILIAPINAAFQPVPSPQWLRRSVLKLRQEETIHLEGLITQLISMGYHRVQTVERPGELAVRGGIVDIYGSSFAQPVRLELLGDSLESLREFDSITQRSTKSIDEAIILPAQEEDISDESYTSMELSEYFPSYHLYILNEPEELVEKLKEAQEEKEKSGSTQLLGSLDGNHISHPGKLSEKSSLPTRTIVELRALPFGSERQKDMIIFESKSPAAMGLGGKATPFTKTISELQNLCNQYQLFVVCRGHDQQQRFQEILMEHEIQSSRHDGLTLSDLYPSTLKLVVGHLSAGFFLKNLSLGFITEEEIFGKTTYHPVKRAKLRPFLTSFEDLKISDHVVHLHYGIGRFLGLQRLIIGGFETDFLVIEYADGGKVYVPLDHLDLVQKYIGAEGSLPKLDRLGTTTWDRTKQRVKKEIQRMTHELLDLYATRKITEGFPFSADNLTHKEFEATFEYEETPDQIRAIEEVKADMELPRAMDRVVCGDVGYGKTEVAMRAAFKSVLDDKQVALLVPTTLLAQQHFQTFSRRFSTFPVRVEMLSRFRTPKEQKTIVQDLAQGKVDIIIGTHRVLQKDISFRDLGLVIIDEEQRFGVSHKEQFKQLRKTVDALTLTATPIPRTLQMSFMGVRDLSIIDTPPPDRLSIKTFITHFDKKVIREAILRELGRGGQVFFVHNRVKGIERMAHFLKEGIPEAKIVIAHGQMKEQDLERVMRNFLEKEANLLITTAIIESGLDIPEANTIIINRADQFGLADLYQLRGRVGRSRSQAYAYLLIPDSSTLTGEAKKRLEALQEFSELGGGFKIAARDLEIRGAGNLLGSKQSGHIAAIGFELYLQMIEQTAQELKGKIPEEEIEPSLNLRVTAYLPSELILFFIL